MSPEAMSKNYEDRLAEYAMHSRHSLGRDYPEPEHPYRSIYQRDRDRIVHSSAFRKLEYKTQVFVNHEGDNFRTRLTHSIEVAQISRSVARALGLNEDLTEAIALSHDLGHTPFGHAGEDALNEALQQHYKRREQEKAEILAEAAKDGGGGESQALVRKKVEAIDSQLTELKGLRFEHNMHGLRIVEKLEDKYPGFRGLNLTYELRESMAKHQTMWDHPQGGRFDRSLKPLLEAQVVDHADSIAYDNHDIEDSINMGIMEEKDFETVDMWNLAQKHVNSLYPTAPKNVRILQSIKTIIDAQVTDLIHNTLANIEKYKIKTVEDVRKCEVKLSDFSPDMAKRKREFQRFMYDNVYCHYKVARMAHKARRFLRELFSEFATTSGRRLLPKRYQDWVDEVGLIGICDYLAGMTDRQAQDEYKKLFQPFERV